MKKYPVTSPVTVELQRGNIGLYEPTDGTEYQEGLPWAVLATMPIVFHFGSKRQRYKVLRVRVQLGHAAHPPTDFQLSDAFGMARSLLIQELHAHGVWGATEADLDLYECGITSFRQKSLPVNCLEPF